MDETIILGYVHLDDTLREKMRTAESLGHQVLVLANSPNDIRIVASGTPVEPTVCATCHRTIRQSWKEDCPACEGPLHPAHPVDLEMAITDGEED